MGSELSSAKYTPSHKVYQSPIVRIIVGTSKTSFDVHKDLLCHYFSYFRGALTGDFQEAKSLQIVLDEETPEIMELLVRYLYTRTLYDPQEIEPNSEHRYERTEVSLPQLTLVDIWIFGDRRGVPNLQNISIDSLHQHMWQSCEADGLIVPKIYAETIRGAKPRDLIVERFITVGREVEAKDCEAQIPDFLLEMTQRYLELRAIAMNDDVGIFNWAYLDLCRFHIHHGNKDCKGRDVVSPPSLNEDHCHEYLDKSKQYLS